MLKSGGFLFVLLYPGASGWGRDANLYRQVSNLAVKYPSLCLTAFWQLTMYVILLKGIFYLEFSLYISIIAQHVKDIESG